MEKRHAAKSPSDVPDVRDGLTRRERIVLHVLAEARRELGDRYIPTAMIYGRVCAYLPMTPRELEALLARLGGRGDKP